MTSSTPPSRQDRREAVRADRRQRQRKQQATQRRNRLLAALAGVIAVAVIAVVSVIVIGNQDDDPSPTNLAPMVAVVDPYPGITQQAKVLGDPTALRLVEYGDYQCPICQQVEETIVPELVQRYVATGVLSFEFRDYLVIDGNLSQRDPDYDRESLRAAEGAMCAADQGQYWAFHASLYRNHTGEGVGDFSDARVRQLAAGLGLDGATFNSCLDDGPYRAMVQQQSTEAQAAGITGTPTFQINGQPVTGQTIADFTAQIDAILVANGITPPAEGAPAVPTTDPAVATPVAVLPGRVD